MDITTLHFDFACPELGDRWSVVCTPYHKDLPSS